jgi:hypothetical protein
MEFRREGEAIEPNPMPNVSSRWRLIRMLCKILHGVEGRRKVAVEVAEAPSSSHAP